MEPGSSPSFRLARPQGVPLNWLWVVGLRGLEPRTSSLSGCRATALTIELPASSWAAAVGVFPGFPRVNLCCPALCGDTVGSPWGQLWTAIYGADEGDPRPSAPALKAAIGSRRTGGYAGHRRCVSGMLLL